MLIKEIETTDCEFLNKFTKRKHIRKYKSEVLTQESIPTVKPQKPKTPDDARIDALKAQKDRASDALKQARAQNKLKQAQQALATANK